jgi:cell division transport system permease protein
MAFRADYLIRETGQNLFRNPSLSLATILTVAVSLSLMGAALLVQQGVGRINNVFRDEVEFIVWMDRDVEDEQVQSTADFLTTSPFIRDHRYIDQEETYEEFQTYFADEPEILELVLPEQLPTSFQVTPQDAEVESIRSIALEIEILAGVDDVEFASDNIKAISSFSRGSSQIMLFAALLSAVAAAMLMYNSIRTAVFARRREIEVMRLVGATKWFIRIPFMLEGLLQGVLGAFLSIFAVFGLNRAFDNFFGSLNSFVFRDFAIPSSQILVIGGALMAVGAVLGAIGAGVAVTKYLDA